MLLLCYHFSPSCRPYDPNSGCVGVTFMHATSDRFFYSRHFVCMYSSGNIFCGACSPHRAVHPATGASVRLCTRCNNQVTRRRAGNARTKNKDNSWKGKMEEGFKNKLRDVADVLNRDKFDIGYDNDIQASTHDNSMENQGAAADTALVRNTSKLTIILWVILFYRAFSNLRVRTVNIICFMYAVYE